LSYWQWALVLTNCALVFSAIATSLLGRNRYLSLILLTICLVSAAFVVGAGYAVGFRLVGRHFAFLVSPIMLVVTFGLLSFPLPVRAFVVVAAVFCLLASSLTFRLDGNHRKEDFRTATAWASESAGAGKVVWWVANPLPLLFAEQPWTELDAATQQRDTTGIVLASNRSQWRDIAPEKLRPDLIIVERPEVNDSDRFFERIAGRLGLTRTGLPGFATYSSPGSR
jgi:hypothetical protein